MKDNLLSSDLDFILSRTVSLWNELKGERIFITGGTGFFGRWLLESFVWINKKLKLNAKATILTRNIKSFSEKCPILFNEQSLQFYEGNIIDCKFPTGSFTYVIHAATDGNYVHTSPLEMLNTIFQGTKNCLEFANSCGVKKFLFISSGAMYGLQPVDLQISEKNLSHLDVAETTTSYAAGKFIAEFLCKLYARQYGFAIKIARCFAFFGPYLPLDLHYAMGNFILNRLNNEHILIKGNGQLHRSYLYTADLCIWLWTILFRGRNLIAYNVGSNEVYSLKEIAYIIANIMEPKVEVFIENSSFTHTILENYIPDITLAKKELNLTPRINLLSGLTTTLAWFLSKKEIMLAK